MEKNFWGKIYFIFILFIVISSQIYISGQGNTKNLDNFAAESAMIIPMSEKIYGNETHFNFTVQEKIRRQDPWYYNQQSVTLEVPEKYTRLKSDFVFEIRNESISRPITNTNFSDVIDVGSKYAQNVYFPEDMDLIGISLYLSFKQATYFTIEIRNENHTGPIVSTLSNLFYGNYNGWYSIEINDIIHLTKGNMVFIFEPQSTTPQFKKMYHSPIGQNVSKTWIYDGTWNIVDYDLTMELNVTKFVSPESVDLKIDGISVENGIDNLGLASIEKTVINNPVILPITSNASVKISYSVNSTFMNENPLSYQIIQEGDIFRWNLTISPQNYSNPYTDYEIYIKGLRSDYSNFAAFYDNNSESFQILPNMIAYTTSPITMFSFSSLNYIESINIPDYSVIGEEMWVNTTGRAAGNFTLNIYPDSDENFSIFHETISGQTSANFLINLPTNFSGDSLELELIYEGNNEFGYLILPLNVFKKMEIVTTDYHAKTFEKINIICQARNLYSHNAVDEAEVHLYLQNLDITMNLTENEIYQATVDLNQLNLPSGTYKAVIQVQAEQFIAEHAEISLIVEKRSATIIVLKDRSTIQPGKTINWQIQLNDGETQKNLLRPVKITTQITAMSNHNQSGISDYQTINDVSQEVDLEWSIPKSADYGSYMLQVNITSDYYSGIKSFPEIVNVVKPVGWYVYFSIFLGLVGGSSVIFFYYQEKIRRSLSGIIILHSNGLPLAYKLSGNLIETDAVLISAALTGVISIMKEITGSQARIIEIEGGYIQIVKMEEYWVIIFTTKSPVLIKPIILKFIKDLDQNYVPKEIIKHPRPFYVDFDHLSQQYFHITIPSKFEAEGDLNAVGEHQREQNNSENSEVPDENAENE